MSLVPELLRKAYMQLEAGERQSARLILESVIRINPAHIEAWEIFLQISESCQELDSVCSQMVNAKGIAQPDLDALLDYYYFLRQKLKIREAGCEHKGMVTLELVDQFTYSLKEKDDPMSPWIGQLNPSWFKSSGILGYVILLVYAGLLAIGLRLIALKNDIGYWLIMILAISIFISLWNSLTQPENDPSA